MAYQKYSGYQYETSPRKVEPEYEAPKNPYKQKKTSAKTIKKVDVKKSKKEEAKRKTRVVMLVAVIFTVLFAISYRNSVITKTFNEKQALETKLSGIQKENAQLKVNIEKSLNLTSIEQAAKTQLGMQKLDNSQKKYVNLNKKDYVESGTEEVMQEESTGLVSMIINTITKIFK